MAKKKSTSSNKNARLTDIKQTVTTTASSAIDEIEKAGDVVVREVRDAFKIVSAKAAIAARTAADASVNVKGIVSDADPKQLFHSLIEEVEEVSEQIIDVVKARFNQLSEATTGAAEKKAVKKKAVKKKAVKKKAVKKKAVKKKAVKKKVVKKKVVKTPVKKKTGRKKALKKKAAK
jgi:hypothetical protein